MENWYFTDGAAGIPTPALLIYPDRIEENIRRMVRIAGSPGKLRPHVKTHKMSEIVKMQILQGITRFKCSTVTEAEMTASAGGPDVLLAMQPVGIQIDRFLSLIDRYPRTRFSVIVDSPAIALDIAGRTHAESRKVDLWVDINNGMNRTGLFPGREALQLYQYISDNPNLMIRGLHIYDGHIHESNPKERQIRCENDFKPVNDLISAIRNSGLGTPVIVAGGTPTFPFHAQREHTELSPGTCVLWDSGYEENFPDLNFQTAAVLLMSVVSKPAKGLICLDLGHKAIAAEMPQPRIKFLNLTATGFVNHSEEHLVVETPDSDQFECGKLVYGIPRHICPTVPRYPFAYCVQDGKISAQWKIDARDRI